MWCLAAVSSQSQDHDNNADEKEHSEPVAEDYRGAMPVIESAEYFVGAGGGLVLLQNRGSSVKLIRFIRPSSLGAGL
jgi:hypothetical protein